MKLLKVTNAAKQKGVSRAAVMAAVGSQKITCEMVDGTPHILQNRAFEVWKPGVKKRD